MSLRNTILRGVYDQNLEINDDHHRQQKTKVNRPRKPASRIIILIVFAAVLFAVQYIHTGDIAPDDNYSIIEAPAQVKEAGFNESLPDAEPAQLAMDLSEIPNQFLDAPTMNDLSPPLALNIHQLLDYSLILDNDKVRLSSVFGLDVQTIVIDPGHGGRDPGAIGKLGTMEKDVVLDIAKGLKKQLEKSSRYHVILTRDEDKSISLADRINVTNAANADLFISLHVNALPQEKFNVTETYYYGPPSDSKTLKLAEQENKGSGISTKDFEKMIQKITDTFKEQESANLAMSIQHSLFTNVKKYDKDITNAGVKIAPFVVLLGVNAPSALVEISCITNKEEEFKLNIPSYRGEITTFLAEGIIRYLNRRNLYFSGGEQNGQENRSESS